MPGRARVVIAGCPHHVTQRGNRRQNVFFSDSDRTVYISLMRKYFCLSHLQLAGYTLMTNHVHHIPIPEFANSLAKGLRLLHQDFSRWQNIQQNVTGHLWQNRFFSCPLDEDHFWKALRYVELNPVRAGLVRDAWEWPWSSARAHITGVDDSGLLNMEMWGSRFDGNSWKEFLKEGLTASDRDHIRMATRTGRPLGTDDFVRQLEKLTGRSLRPRKPGPKSRLSGVSSGVE